MLWLLAWVQFYIWFVCFCGNGVGPWRNLFGVLGLGASGGRSDSFNFYAHQGSTVHGLLSPLGPRGTLSAGL